VIHLNLIAVKSLNLEDREICAMRTRWLAQMSCGCEPGGRGLAELRRLWHRPGRRLLRTRIARRCSRGGNGACPPQHAGPGAGGIRWPWWWRSPIYVQRSSRKRRGPRAG